MTESIGRHGMYRRWGKRTFDFLVSGTGLVILLPLLAVLSLLILTVSGRPLFFRQMRPGRNERLFALVKFRTMKPATESVPDAERLTPLGKLLRRTSLDELPSLWNVVCGDMSLVGPRPLLVEYLARYSNEQRRRHCVRPGLTGWAQVRGRNVLSWQEKFAHDVWYVDNYSLALDLRILMMTPYEVISGRGVNAPGHSTMYEFLGNRPEPRPKLEEPPADGGH